MLTLQKAREHAESEVERMGAGFRYTEHGADTGCFYVPLTDSRVSSLGRSEDDPAMRTGCLVGSIITRAGLMTDYIARSSGTVVVLIHQGDLRVESDLVIEYLSSIQFAQDSGVTWGEAYAEAEAWLSHQNVS